MHSAPARSTPNDRSRSSSFVGFQRRSGNAPHNAAYLRLPIFRHGENQGIGLLWSTLTMVDKAITGLRPLRGDDFLKFLILGPIGMRP